MIAGVRQSVALGLLAVTLLLAGCGFHLRGSFVLPAHMERVYVQGDLHYSQVMTELRDTLSNGGVTVVNNADDASVVLKVLGEDYERRILAVGSDGRPSEYELTYRLRYEVRSPAGEVLLAPQVVTQVRQLAFDQASVLAKSAEEEELQQDMRRQAVLAVMRRLQHVPAPTTVEAQ